MLSRRDALKTLALSSGAVALLSPEGGAQTLTEVHKLPALGYDYDALEPFLDAETMRLHHGKHHATYVAKLNQAIEKEPSLASRSLDDLLKNLQTLPETVRSDIRNHAGGHYNHSLFWKSLRKKEANAPSESLTKALEKHFGSLSAFQEKLQTAALKVFGSGWAWLCLHQGQLTIETTSNQDCPLSTGSFPLLGIDVWEHAYYLKFQNRRADYLKSILQIIHWDFVEERLKTASA